MTITDFHQDRLVQLKSSFTTRNVPISDMKTILTDDLTPSAGDLVLARVKKIGHHKRIQLRSRRPSQLFRDEEIVLCFGARYAPDQFEAELPRDLDTCHMAAAGGIAGKVVARHQSVGAPTEIEPIGYVGDERGHRLNIAQYRLPSVTTVGGHVPTIGVVGTSMNAGKTAVAAHIIKGFARAGFKVGAAKVTGTGAFADVNLFADAGARWVVDFTDAGYASTYKLGTPEIIEIHRTLTAHLAARGASAIVIEVADGQFQSETAAFVGSDAFKSSLDGVVFAAGDAAGAESGCRWLAGLGLPPLAVSGCVTKSPLGMREAEAMICVPTIRTFDLADPATALTLIAREERLSA